MAQAKTHLGAILTFARPWKETARAAALALALATLAWGQAQRMPVSGSYGGALTVPVGADPQTLNPAFAMDSTSQLLASLTMADLMHINPRTLRVEPALATRVDHRSDRVWVVHLRHGVRFSDGAPFTAADVAFSFQVYTDPTLDAPERSLLTVKGVPVRCKVLASDEVELDLPGPIAVGDRLFDSVWMLPRHLLLGAYQSGQLAHAWSPDTHPAAMAGLGAFRLEAFQPGREIRLGRNPYYWRADASGRRLPFLNALHLSVVADPSLRLTLFVRGQVDGLEALDSADFHRLRGDRCCRLQDAGPGLNAEVMVFNQAPSAPGAPAPARAWFRQAAFRRAVSQAVDRANLARNVYHGLAAPLASLTSPSEGMWADPTPAAIVNDAAALATLRQAGFQLRQKQLYDAQGRAVAFSLIVPASSAERMQLAVFLQEDLRRVGMAVQVVPLDFASYLQRLLDRHDFEAALVGIQSPDADPNSESNEWPLNGPWHFWNPDPQAPTPWEKDLDRWFHLQMVTTRPAARLRVYRRMQQVEHHQLPLVPLLAPDILVGAKPGLEGVAPALLPPHLLWNADELHWAAGHGNR
ncbi:MAG TPA: ABC transporter substrate-binding protein [Terriglobales bacterium]|nr:ABC transporter substrate-binding protein [Terriglobales bacterium]